MSVGELRRFDAEQWLRDHEADVPAEVYEALLVGVGGPDRWHLSGVAESIHVAIGLVRNDPVFCARCDRDMNREDEEPE